MAFTVTRGVVDPWSGLSGLEPEDAHKKYVAGGSA